jgi:anti-sigma factor RsiW
MSSWRCRFYRSLLVDYADGGLDPRRRQRVEKHLARCAGCTADVAALQQIPALLQTSTVPDPGEEFWGRQQQSIRRAVRMASPREERSPGWLHDALQQRRWRYAVALAASIVVMWSVYRLA